MSNQEIRIKLKSFDHKLLAQVAKNIRDALSLTGASIRGPIPMPSHRSQFTVNRSPHIDKKSREQFELKTYIILILIDYLTPQTIDTLQSISLPAGVNVKLEAR
jgi:small subunit ribosomal protein S10